MHSASSVGQLAHIRLVPEHLRGDGRVLVILSSVCHRVEDLGRLRLYLDAYGRCLVEASHILLLVLVALSRAPQRDGRVEIHAED